MKSFYLIAFFFISTDVFTQHPAIDSLQKVLKTQKEDTNKVKTLTAICDEKSDIGEYEKARKYADEALALSEKIGFKRGAAVAYNRIGRIYLLISDFPKALEYYQKGLTICEQVGIKSGMALNLQGIGLVYSFVSDFPKALEYDQQALIINEQLGYKEGVATNLSNIGDVNLSLSNYSKALEFNQKALNIYEQLGKKINISIALGKIGEVYEALSDYPKALEYFQKALLIAEESGNKNVITGLYNSIGHVYQKQDNNNEALKFVKKSLALALDISNLSLIRKAYEDLAIIHSAMNNFREAYENHKRFKQINDSIYGIEKDKKITALQMRYEFDKLQNSARAEQAKKDAVATEELQKQKVVRNFSVAGAVALLSLGGFAFYNFRRRKKLEKERALADERLRISRDLHDDMGASLSSISVFSSAVKQKLNNNETHEAQQLLERMSTDAQEMVSGMSEMVWTISPHNDTIEKLTDRLQLYATGMMSAKNISFSLECDEELKNRKLPVEMRKNIFLILKEAINNAAKYSGATEVNLAISKKENRFVVVLVDNGNGFDLAHEQNQNGKTGNGLRNMHQRAYEIQSRIKIMSELNKGTSVTFLCSLPKIGEL